MAAAVPHNDHVGMPDVSDKGGERPNFNIADLSHLPQLSGISEQSQKIADSIVGPANLMLPSTGLKPGETGKV